MDVYADKIRKGRALYSQMLRANITKVSISETPSIRAFGDPLVRARKAGVCRIKTPTLCREGNKSRVGNGEKILTHYHVKSIMSIDLRSVNNKILCG